jgi:MFS transporter, ACS family, D-galactonate transporter
MKSDEEYQVTKSKVGALRRGILLAVFLAYLVAYFDRANVMVLIANLNFTDAIGITTDKSAQGMLMTIFLLLYGVTSFFAGPVVHRFGARNILFYSIILWSVFMGIMGAVSAFIIMIICRALLGTAEAVVGPSVSKTIQTWFSPRERSRANAVWYVAIILAPILSVPMIAWLVDVVGWRGSFYTLSFMSLFPLLAIWYFVRDIPSTHPKVGKKELEQIMAGREEEGKAIEEAAKGDFRFLRQSSYWYLTFMYCMMNCALWGIVTWLPTYFTATLGFSWKAMGILAAVPYVFAAVSVLGVTPFMDKFNFRAPFVIILSIGVAISLFVAMNVKNSYGVVLIFSIALGFAGPITPALFTMLQNSVKPNQISQGTGFFNGFAYVAAATVPITMGALYNITGSLRSGFYLLCGMVLIGMLGLIPLFKKKL